LEMAHVAGHARRQVGDDPVPAVGQLRRQIQTVLGGRLGRGGHRHPRPGVEVGRLVDDARHRAQLEERVRQHLPHLLARLRCQPVEGAHACSSGSSALRRVTYSSSSSRTASSSGGGSYSDRILFHTWLARCTESKPPSSCHCSKLELSARADVQKAVSKLASVCSDPRKCSPGRWARRVSRARPLGDMSTPSSRAEAIDAWSASSTNFSYPITSPPSSQPAACSTKLTPARSVGKRVAALS